VAIRRAAQLEGGALDSNEDLFTTDVCRQLQDDGYQVHVGSECDRDLAGHRWFTWCKAGMTEPEVGPTCDTEFDAWSSALRHRLANSEIPLDQFDRGSPAKPMGPFHPAQLPESAFDVPAMAAKFGVSHETAAAQVEHLRRQTVHMNEIYQVNVQCVEAPFGTIVGDMLWLSIKRRDKGVIRDWRQLQEIKNRIVGPEHEGFEVYPAETRLVDTANQWHLWVFADSKVRLPVGFKAREVGGRWEAEAVGARQRAFAGA
jgi:hypothetical protein